MQRILGMESTPGENSLQCKDRGVGGLRIFNRKDSNW